MKRKDKMTVFCMALYSAAVFCMFFTYGVHSTAAEKPEMILPETTATEPAYLDPDMAENDPGALPALHVIENCTVTYYCAERYPHICGTGDGITATGTEAIPGVTCAVDPSVIPYGSIVTVDYGDGALHEYIAQDAGAWIDGQHIDICVDKHAEALELGKAVATVYWR